MAPAGDPTAAPRLPYVPPPLGETAVSPKRTSTSSIGTPSSSAAIWAKAVSLPCPCGVAPVMTTTLPVGWHRLVAASPPPPPHGPPPASGPPPPMRRGAPPPQFPR